MQGRRDLPLGPDVAGNGSKGMMDVSAICHAFSVHKEHTRYSRMSMQFTQANRTTLIIVKYQCVFDLKDVTVKINTSSGVFKMGVHKTKYLGGLFATIAGPNKNFFCRIPGKEHLSRKAFCQSIWSLSNPSLYFASFLSPL